eukprot:1142220-Alexandrium_andersonii.AAC.1
MSASLVGSEMCIRDRRSISGRVHACAAREHAKECHERDSTHCNRPARQAVSYTHLTLPTICSV